MAIIYTITNTVTQKKYVGCTTRTLAERWNLPPYYNPSRHTKNLHSPLYDDFETYGRESFIIEEVETCNNDERFDRETYWIIKLNTLVPYGYNSIKNVSKVALNFSDQEVLDEIERRKNLIRASWTPEQIAEWDNFEARFPKLMEKHKRNRYKEVKKEMRRK